MSAVRDAQSEQHAGNEAAASINNDGDSKPAPSSPSPSPSPITSHPTSLPSTHTDATTTATPFPTTPEAQRALASRSIWLCKKRDFHFRARAHSNPLNDGLFTPPLTPNHFPLPHHYTHTPTPTITWCDIGCGYGSLLASLSAAYPDQTMLGLEIRDRVAAYCSHRLAELRAAHPGQYGNIWFERTNAMKFLPNYLSRGTLQKLFFCYPDPHFKRKKNRQRIISAQLLAEYAYVLCEGSGVAYIVTDVPELFQWMVERFERHPLFERRSKEEHDADIVSGFVRDMTDEAQRVDKSDRGKYDASFRRVVNPI